MNDAERVTFLLAMVERRGDLLGRVIEAVSDIEAIADRARGEVIKVIAREILNDISAVIAAEEAARMAATKD